MQHTEPMVSLRTTTLASRSVKGESQKAGINLAIACMDLTTLEGGDTPHRVARLAARAAQPDPTDPTCPQPAAICVYPNRVTDARTTLNSLGAHTIAVASVATGFPAGLTPTHARQTEIAAAIKDGATEIDTVLDRSAFLAGDRATAAKRIRAEKEACGTTHLKVILETAELGSLDAIYQAAWLAARNGADFLKTSTGKGPGGATLNAAWTLALVANRASSELARPIGVKLSGGIRTAKDALRYMLVVADANGPDSLTPTTFRIGASTLLDDLTAQRLYHKTGRYHGPDYFPVN